MLAWAGDSLLFSVVLSHRVIVGKNWGVSGEENYECFPQAVRGNSMIINILELKCECLGLCSLSLGLPVPKAHSKWPKEEEEGNLSG